MKVYKVEIKLSDKQISKFRQMQGTCRWLYNEYIKTNELLYEMSQLGCSDIKFMSGYDFSKYVNNILSKQPNMAWIKDCGSKSRKQAIMNAEKAFKNFFKGKGFPKLKKKRDNMGIYLPKNNEKDFKVYRHKVKIPIFKEILLNEYGYLPKNAKIKSATIKEKAGRYYISVLVDEIIEVKNKNNNQGIGIDLGIKELAICSDGDMYKNINKTDKVRKLKKKLKRKQRALSRKFENLKKSKEVTIATKKNIEKDNLSVQKIYNKLSNIRTEYIRFIVNDIIKREPNFIVLEKLNLKGMMKNRHLSKAIAEQNLFYFKQFLIQQCRKYNIEVREVSQWYPSSKLCNECGQIKNDLKLSDRIYECDCGYIEDRDLNASKNLRDCDEYIIL